MGTFADWLYILLSFVITHVWNKSHLFTSVALIGYMFLIRVDTSHKWCFVTSYVSILEKLRLIFNYPDQVSVWQRYQRWTESKDIILPSVYLIKDIILPSVYLIKDIILPSV